MVEVRDLRGRVDEVRDLHGRVVEVAELVVLPLAIHVEGSNSSGV